MIASMPITEARKSLGGIVNRASLRGERIALSKNGKEVAVVVSIEDAKLLERLEDAHDVAEAERRLSDPTQVAMPFVPRR
jgi:prevent-host-death family protein